MRLARILQSECLKNNFKILSFLVGDFFVAISLLALASLAIFLAANYYKKGLRYFES
jgi:hypothetical protein